ncbi:MAG: SRPBCC domain-containing protein [Flavobacteriales bacterium]|jgi:hypothetical protein|nr:SRPBCC domain-containing protein [Flavobacteriales bacterium]
MGTNERTGSGPVPLPAYFGASSKADVFLHPYTNGGRPIRTQVVLTHHLLCLVQEGEKEVIVAGHRELDAINEPVPEAVKRYEKGNSMGATVTRCEALRPLGFTRRGDPQRLSEVVIELNERGKDVLLVLMHERLPDGNDLLGVSGGWHTHLDILVEHLNGREHRDLGVRM